MVEKELTFSISPEVLALGLKGAYFAINEVQNRDTDPEFVKMRDQILQDKLTGLSEDQIEQDKTLQGFRLLHEAVGASNRKNVASPENLLWNILRNGNMTHINLLVDIYNLVSIQSRLALGAHDIAKISGNVNLRLTNGNEKFQPLGANELKPVRAGQYAYVDDDNDVICMYEVRQVEKTKTEVSTRDYFFIVQGNSFTDTSYIREYTERLIELIKRFCGGQERMLYTPW